MKKTFTFFVLLMLSALSVSAVETVPGTFEQASAPSLMFSAMTSNGIVPVVTEHGKIAVSIDGVGGDNVPLVIEVEKPAGATVRAAYMAAASVPGYSISPGDIKIDGSNFVWTQTKACAGMSCMNYWGNVTSIVKPTIDAAPAGRVSFTISETVDYQIDGEILVVIFDDPTESENTVILLFGAQAMSGDTFSIGLAEPLDTSNPDLILAMSLGISYSYQSGDAQYSIVDVNGARLTTSAGGEDDGGSYNGGLMTVGGLDDSPMNPVDPYATAFNDFRIDDELYNLLGFVETGDTGITVDTSNPSNDDNILFAGFFLGSATAVVGEGIVLGPAHAINYLGEEHTVTATVQDDDGNPIEDKFVTIEITSGPHAGLYVEGNTDANGQITFTYTGIAEGLDEIVAWFYGPDLEIESSNVVTKEWQREGNNDVPEFTTIGAIVALLGAGAIVYRRRK